MTYHKINNENNSTNIDQFVNQTEFNERMSVTNMVSWAEWTTLVYGLLIISVEILQVIIKNSSKRRRIYRYKVFFKDFRHRQVCRNRPVI